MSDQLTDPIRPVEIEHAIDEVYDGDKLEQRYNFLDYHFERDEAYCRARSYADDFQTVTLFGPFENKGSIQKVSRPDLERDVLRYLQRRFRNVKPTPEDTAVTNEEKAAADQVWGRRVAGIAVAT